MQKPNILFIMADQMTACALSLYGSGQAKTPALDRLAARGIRFQNAYCNFPLCGPSRQSMMSGRLPSRCGAYDNATMLSSDTPTFAHYLAAAGYRTCLSGKMHFVGPNQLHGFQERLTTDVYPSDFAWTPDWTAAPGETTFQNMDNIFSAGPCTRSMQLDYDEDVAYQAERWLFDTARRDDDAPWMLTVSFTHPHDPYQATAEFWDKYDHDDIHLPRVGKLEGDDLDAHSQRLRQHYSLDDHDVSPDAMRKMRHGYYAAISYIDAKVDRLLQVLDDCDQTQNTIVMFTSDHGDMMGERDLFYKKCFFEWASRVPLIMAGPGVESGIVDRPVSLVDILPTLCDIADVPPLACDGQSLLGDHTAPVFAEMLSEGVTAPAFMLRDGDFKLLWSKEDPPVLYDLARDPDERQNLAQDPVHKKTLDRLIALAQATWDSDALRQDVIDSQARRRLLREAGVNGWDFAPDLSMKDRYVRAGKWTTEVEASCFLPPKA